MKLDQKNPIYQSSEFLLALIWLCFFHLFSSFRMRKRASIAISEMYLRKFSSASWHWQQYPLREKRPNTELFLLRIFPKYFSVLCPNAGKYGPEITPYLDVFHGRKNASICNLLNLLFFLQCKARIFHVVQVVKYAQSQTIKTPEYVKLTNKSKTKTPLTSFCSRYW